MGSSFEEVISYTGTSFSSLIVETQETNIGNKTSNPL